VGIKIRAIEKNEYPSFTATADYIAGICFSNGLVLLAETENGFPMGVLAAKKAMMFQEVSYIFVKPIFRNRGIATELFAKLIELSQNVTIRIKDDHPFKEALHALVVKFALEYDYSACSYIADVKAKADVHQALYESRYKRIIDRLLSRGYVLKRFEECENVVKRIGELVGTEFEYNTNPMLFSNYDPRYSYCLLRDNQPLAFSLIETVGDMAVFHLLSRAEHSAPGAFLLPLAQTFTDLVADGFWKVSFVIYSDNDRMRALSDTNLITHYVNKVQPFKVFSKKTFLHPR
jgi:GNAT superfamily N-acetyltransferase